MLIPASVIRIAGYRPDQVYRGIVLRILSQVFAVVPFFMAWLAVRWILADEISSSQWGGFALALGLCLLGQLVLSHYGQMDCFIGTYTLMKHYRAAIMDRLRLMPLGFFQRQRDGSLASLLTDDIKQVEDMFTHVIAEVITGMSVPLFFSLILLWVDWRLTLSLLITLPLAWLLLQGFKQALLQRGQQQAGRYAQVSGLLVEYIAGIRLLRLFNCTHWMLTRLDNYFEQIRRGSIRIEAFGGAGVLLFRLVLEMGLVTLLLAGGWLLSRGTLDIVTWLLFILVAYKIVDSLLDVVAYLTQLRVMRQAIDRLDALMLEPVMAEQTAVTLPKDLTLCFDQVSFRYQDEWVLHEVNCTILPGTVTAIVGASGSGKSTMLHLIGRFFDPQQGQIRLGGVDLQACGTQALYDRIGFVFQDVRLFDGTVLDNVRIGCQSASDEQVYEACRQADCQQFIEQLEQGYHTMLGEGGQRLSGGERQRLSIARMWLKNPQIILLDEATASVDPCSQNEIQRALSRLAQHRTVVMIAHRLRTVEYADQILVMDQGRIVESGQHQQLLQQQGWYWRLWQTQNKSESQYYA